MFLLQLFVLLIGPQLHREKSFQRKLPLYFTAATERVDNTEYYISRDFCHDPNRLLVLAWKLDFEIGHQ